jgi:hypothetical protein
MLETHQMPAPKGSHNASAYQKTIVADVEKSIEECLAVVSRSSIIFQNVSSLATYLAPLVGRTPNRLRRNTCYRQMLDAYISSQRGAASIIGERDQNVHVLQAKLSAVRLECSNLKRDRDRLSMMINKHYSGTNDTSSILPSRAELTEAEKISCSGYQQAFESTALILANVLGRIGDELGYEVDFEKRRIVDRSARPGDQQVAGPNQAQWFIEWLMQKS